MKLSKNKKGVELTFNTIVIIVLVLLVLVILAFILMKGFGNSQTAMSCAAQGGECKQSTNGACPTDWYPRPWGCSEKGTTCCTNKLI